MSLENKYFAELARRLRAAGITAGRPEKNRLTVLLNNQPVLSVSAGSDVFLLPAGSNQPEAGELYHKVAQTADEVYAYRIALNKLDDIAKGHDTLRERGIAAAPLRSQYKDWNADLKALHGLPAEPAEEHPQLLAADPICQRIGAAVSSGVAKPEQAEQKLPILLQDYKNHLHQGRFDRAMDAMELAAAMALSSALREFRQMGKVVSPQQGAERLRQSIQPHHNRGSLKNRADEIAMELQRILAQKASAGICGRESKESLAYRWLELAASCAKVPIRYEADQIKQRQKEEQAQRGAGPVME